MEPITADAINAAHARIAPHVRRTPVLDVEPAAFGTPGPVALKLELLQHTGSFKPRGAFNRLLSHPASGAGVVAASGGNHGLGVAHAARTLGLAATIFVPTTTPEVKVSRLRALGAVVRLVGDHYAEALEASASFAEGSGALVAHAYDQPEIVAGQGTVALELQQQRPDLDTLLVAVGGGGLIAGVAGWYGGSVRVVAVEAHGTATYAAALEAGGPVDIEVGGLTADSLGARRLGDHAWAARPWIAGSVVVADEDVRAAQRALLREVRLITEPGGATAMAALLGGHYRPQGDERVGVLVCGANTDPLSIDGEEAA
ncbi:MAG: threonine/serine dehydratase [Actinobacteria bacterium]|nr:threonine/serine dehydratase [Actinomycetota bacterium]